MDFTNLPIGFGMTLAENEVALNVFNAMGLDDKQMVLERAQQAKSQAEMHRIITSLAEKGQVM